MTQSRTPDAEPQPRATVDRRGREGLPIAVVVSDDPLERVLLARALVRCGWQVRAVEAKDDVAALAADGPEIGMILLDARGAPTSREAELVLRQWPTASVIAWTSSGAAAIEAAVGVPVHARVLTLDPRSGERALRPVAQAILARVLEREARRARQPSTTRVAVRVLVVEDDDVLRETLVELLETDGYSTRAARDGNEALEILRADAVSVVLLDLLMPRVDGYAFREAQRADPAIADVPVLVLTAERRADVDRLAGAEIVFKPFDVAPLLARIRALVERDVPARAAGA